MKGYWNERRFILNDVFANYIFIRLGLYYILCIRKELGMGKIYKITNKTTGHAIYNNDIIELEEIKDLGFDGIYLPLISKLEIIAKEHFCKYPEEIIPGVSDIDMPMKGMVSHDEVMRVFDDTSDDWEFNVNKSSQDYVDYIRNALQNIKEKK